MSTANALWVAGQRLDLFDDTALLPTFQANDRTKPESIQSDYSPEFEVPGTAHNHRLLKHAAASQPAQGQAYARLPCVLTSGGVEILPLGILLVKGYAEGRYKLQLLGGNRRLVEALGEKTLADLDLSRFDHAYTAANVLAALPYAHWQAQGWGYEATYDRGKPLDLQAVDPFALYPSVSYLLVLQQLLADAGFTADSLADVPLFAALNVPSANAYVFAEKYRDARQLTAGYTYRTDPNSRYYYYHNEGFAAEQLLFDYTARKPFCRPEAGTGSTYAGGTFTAGTLGYYDLEAQVPAFWGCNERLPGKVRIKFMLKINGQSVFAANGDELGKDEAEGKGYQAAQVFNPKLSHYLLQVGDTVTLHWRGDEIEAGFISPDQPRWSIGPYGPQVELASGRALAAGVSFTATLLPDFPPGGLVRLQDWLPSDMTQLAFFKSALLLGGITCQVDPYTNHLRLATGVKLLENVPRALDWTRKRDAFAPPGRLPERALEFRFGSYGQRNLLKWAEDEAVTAGYGDGTITVADEVLPASYDLATLPFAATQDSPDVAGLLCIGNYEASDITVVPPTYSSVTAKPRLVLRSADRPVAGQLITTPAVGKPGDQNYTLAVLTAFTTTASYFAGVGVSLLLDGTVLSEHWADLRAMLDESRYLTERYRLTPADIAGLDFTVPIWDGLLGDYFAVSQVGEYDARRPVEVKLCRLNAKYLPPPRVPGAGLQEWWAEEFGGAGEWY